jgi:hypothetical protein
MHMWIIYQCNQGHWTERSKCINSNRGKGGKIHGSKVNQANDRGSRYHLNHGRIYEPDSIVFPIRRLDVSSLCTTIVAQLSFAFTGPLHRTTMM